MKNQIFNLLKYGEALLPYSELSAAAQTHQIFGEQQQKSKAKQDSLDSLLNYSNVRLLDSHDGRQYCIVGVIHHYRENAKQVAQLILNWRPDSVVTELCASRLHLLQTHYSDQDSQIAYNIIRGEQYEHGRIIRSLRFRKKINEFQAVSGATNEVKRDQACEIIAGDIDAERTINSNKLLRTHCACNQQLKQNLQELISFLIRSLYNTKLRKWFEPTVTLSEIMKECLKVPTNNCVLRLIDFTRDRHLLQQMTNASVGTKILAVVGVNHLQSITDLLAIREKVYEKYLDENEQLDDIFCNQNAFSFNSIQQLEVFNQLQLKIEQEINQNIEYFIREQHTYCNQSANVCFRLDRYLKEHCHLNWVQAQTLLRKGKIYVLRAENQRVAMSRNARYLLQSGDTVCVPSVLIENRKVIQKTDENKQQENNLEFAQIFKSMLIAETKHFYVLNKQGGYSSQGGNNLLCNMYSLGLEYAKITEQTDSTKSSQQLPQYYIVHRLDSCTSGVLIAAKNREYAGFFGTLFQERNDLQKLYIAVAQGRIDGGSAWQGKIDLPLQAASGSKQRQSHKEGKQCETHYKIAAYVSFVGGKVHRIFGRSTLDNENRTILEQLQEYEAENNKNSNQKCIWHTVLKVKLVHGRKHQIRAHLSYSLKAPIVGDYKYGYKDDGCASALIDTTQSIFLHCQQIILQEQLIARSLASNLDLKKESKTNSLSYKNANGEIELQEEKFVSLKASFPSHFIQYFLQQDTQESLQNIIESLKFD